jgi:hypothetical protein
MDQKEAQVISDDEMIDCQGSFCRFKETHLEGSIKRVPVSEL